MVRKSMSLLNKVIGSYVGVQTLFTRHATERLLQRFNGQLSKPIVQAIRLAIHNAELDQHCEPGYRYTGIATVGNKKVEAVVTLDESSNCWKILTLVKF